MVHSVRLVFIVGVGRSGTSLLQSMLNAHTDIAFLPETHFFRHYIAQNNKRRQYEKAGAKKFQSILEKDQEFQRCGISPEEVLRPFLNGRHQFNLIDAYTNLLQLYQDQKRVSFVGEKDPRLIDFLPQLKDSYPEAKVIHVIRDPRDVLLSRMKAEWSSGRPDWLHVLTYRAQMAWGRRQGRRWFQSDYLEVRYESLIAEPKKVLQEIAKLIGVPYSDAMLNFDKSARELVDETEYSWKKETLGPLIQNNTEKWRNNLSAWQIRMTECICGEAFQSLGYELADDSFSVLYIQRLLLPLASFAGKIFENFYPAIRRFR